jgi:hypothetical protein
MKLSASSIVVACALILSATPATSQNAPDLTGTWTGRWSCRSFDGAKFNEKKNPSTLRITQSGGTLAAHIDGPQPPQFFYNGALISDGRKPAHKAEVVLSQCGTDNQPVAGPTEAEIVRAQVKTKPNSAKASFVAASIFVNDGPTVVTCRYSYKRLETTDPGVVACP